MKPIRYAPSRISEAEKTLGVQGLEAIRAYPKYGNKEYQLRKKQTPHSYKYECVKQIACRFGLLIALEQKIQSNEKSDRYQISCIQYVHGRADGNQQEINGCLY